MSTGNFNNYNYNHYARTYGNTAGRTGEYASTTLDRTASWCSNCGRRRGNDGRCPDCDPWWTSPVVQFGGPICLLITLILLGGIALSQPRNSTGSGVNVRTVLTSSSVTQTTYTTSNYASYAPQPAYNPPIYTPTMAPANIAYQIPPSMEEIQYHAIEQLRQTTAYTDAVVEQQRQARWQQTQAMYQQNAQNSSGFSRGLYYTIH